MAALPKPYRIAVLLPEVTVDGADSAYHHEAAVLLWTACIEVLQRHGRLAVLDADATPLIAQDGHFAPQHAGPGGRPDDAFYGQTRRDEVIWLEVGLGQEAGDARLHVAKRGGGLESFEAQGRTLGDRIHQLFVAWLGARGLGNLPKRFEPVSAADLLATVRVVAPTLIEQARAWSASDATKSDGERRRAVARPLANRLPQTLRLPALRLLELALRTDLADSVLAVDPDHPQAQFARFVRGARDGKDFALLRQVIASAPGWARPYEELGGEGENDDPFAKLTAPTELETIAAAGIAALCRPGALRVLDTVENRLVRHRRIDEALRFAERGVALHDEDPRAHAALVDLHRATDRPGARLDQAMRSARRHGCATASALPSYPDQIELDLRLSSALLAVGRLDEAIAIRASRLADREAAWPNDARVLASWRSDPEHVARGYARDAHFRADHASVLEGLGRCEPADSLDVAALLDALVATGRADEAPLVWAQFGQGAKLDGAVARFAAARALLAAGEWRRGIDELWRVELTEPGRDDQVAIAHVALVMSAAPIAIFETALGERLAAGTPTLARRMARDVADFVPAAANSEIVVRALGKSPPLGFDPAWLASFPTNVRSRRAIDALFAELGPLRKESPRNFDIADELGRGDRFVERWFDTVFVDASYDDRGALAQAAAYTAAQATARYLAATTAPPTTLTGALRTVAAEAFAMVRRHRDDLGDRDARAVLGTIETVLRRVDRWVGSTWLAVAERSLGIDERCAGDVDGFTRDFPTVAARILGPEETAVLSWSIARLHRDRGDGWAAKVASQASRLAMHTGRAGADEWAEAIVTQLAAREIEIDDAIDALHVASYLAEGVSAGPSVHTARVLFDAGRGPAAFAVLCAGFGAAEPGWRDDQIKTLVEPWRRAKLDVPIEFGKLAAQVLDALQHQDPARAEKLTRWAVAYDPSNGEAHRNLGLALAQQGNIQDALHHLTIATREQAAQIVSGVLYQTGKLTDAIGVLDYASRWYTRAEQWASYASVAHEADDHARTAKAYRLAYQLDPETFDASQLHAYAGVLAAANDFASCENIANHLLRVAGDDLMWKPIAWNHLASAYIGQGRFDDAALLAQRAVDHNKHAELAAELAATLDRARSRNKATPELGDPETMEEQGLAWRARHLALEAARMRQTSESQVVVTDRARIAAAGMLSETAGTMDRDGLLARALALRVREQAHFARDPVPLLGARMTRQAFYQEFRARGGVVRGEAEPPSPKFVDRVVIAGGKVSRASDYITLLRDLSALGPADALAQFDLDAAGYLELARAWAAAIAADPSIARTIAAGLAQR